MWLLAAAQPEKKKAAPKSRTAVTPRSAKKGKSKVRTLHAFTCIRPCTAVLKLPRARAPRRTWRSTTMSDGDALRAFLTIQNVETPPRLWHCTMHGAWLPAPAGAQRVPVLSRRRSPTYSV
jgi:hypothetical protein